MLEALSRLKQSGVGFVYLRAGDEITTRGDLKLSVLHPDAARDFDNANDYFAGNTRRVRGANDTHNRRSYGSGRGL